MKELLEEYGFDIVAALSCAILFGSIVIGISPGGFIERPVVDFIESIIGG